MDIEGLIGRRIVDDDRIWWELRLTAPHNGACNPSLCGEAPWLINLQRVARLHKSYLLEEREHNQMGSHKVGNLFCLLDFLWSIIDIMSKAKQEVVNPGVSLSGIQLS